MKTVSSIIEGQPVPGGRIAASTNPVLDEVVGEVVFGDASTFVRAAEPAKKGTAGQRCTSLGTVIVHESVHTVLMGPMLDARFAERYEEPLG